MKKVVDCHYCKTAGVLLSVATTCDSVLVMRGRCPSCGKMNSKITNYGTQRAHNQAIEDGEVIDS